MVLLVTLTRPSEASVGIPVGLRYTRVAPPSVLPFSAQVSTFTRNLHVFDAPYAAGVLPGPPAIVQRAVLPAPLAPLVPAPFVASHPHLHGGFAPAPLLG